MKRWNKKTVVCIGSGPSLTVADCEMVRKSGLPTIAVNSSWKAARFCDVIYGGDLAWWEAYGREIDIAAERWTCTRQAAVKYDMNLHTAYGAYNSGMRAVQFALEQGADKVILLGFDCSVDVGMHWHGEHDKTQNPDSIKCKKWMAQFSQVAMIAEALKADVVNCSRQTALKCFRMSDLKHELSATKESALLIRGMYGLGDSIYQRGFVKHFPGAYLVTAWPELYADLDVKCVKPETRLRTQSKNMNKTRCKWHQAPSFAKTIQVSYGPQDLGGGSIVLSMKEKFGVAPEFDLPDFGPLPLKSSKPIAIVRPVTVRREWLNPARSPKPEYVNQAARILREKGFHVVSIADIQDGQEWLVGDPPEADEYYHNGELSVTQLLAAVQNAAVVVGGVGWIVPACIAAGTPLYVILGGNGGHNAPEKITDKRYMNLRRVGWAKPERFCMCSNNNHQCEKTINGFDRKFTFWLDGVLPSIARGRTQVVARKGNGVLPGQIRGYAV